LLASDTRPRLLHAGTGAELARLEAGNDNAVGPAAFSPDGASVAVGTDNHTVHVWDLRAVRRQLAEIGLDWDLPPYPPPAPLDSGKPLQVRVDIGNLKTVIEAEDHLQQAGAHVQAGQWNQAVAAYSKALELNPGDPRTHNDLAWLLATCPDPSVRDVGRAPELAQRAVELAPQKGFYWNTLGVAHYRAGDWTASVEALRKSDALLRGEQLGFNAFFLAMAHWQRGDQPEARAWYEKAVAWVESKRAELEPNPQGGDELRRFRAEAATLLGLREPPSPPRKEMPPKKD
jgi:tetratricopeptide (TPR) repeat protein